MEFLRARLAILISSAERAGTCVSAHGGNSFSLVRRSPRMHPSSILCHLAAASLGDGAAARRVEEAKCRKYGWLLYGVVCAMCHERLPVSCCDDVSCFFHIIIWAAPQYFLSLLHVCTHPECIFKFALVCEATPEPGSCDDSVNMQSKELQYSLITTQQTALQMLQMLCRLSLFLVPGSLCVELRISSVLKTQANSTQYDYAFLAFAEHAWHPILDVQLEDMPRPEHMSYSELK